VERVAYGRPLRNLMSAQRVLQNVKEGTEAFDGLFPVGERWLASGRAFEHAQPAVRTYVHAALRVRERGPEEAPAGVEGGRDAPVAKRDAPDVVALSEWV